MDLLARREHSALELRNKLVQRDFDEALIELVLSGLQQDNLQSDSRFTEAYINHRINAGVGPFKISHEMRQKGIDEGLIETFLEPFAGEWEAMMSGLRVRRFGDSIPADYKQRMKQARFLQNRGFSPESVMRLLK